MVTQQILNSLIFTILQNWHFFWQLFKLIGNFSGFQMVCVAILKPLILQKKRQFQSLPLKYTCCRGSHLDWLPFVGSHWFCLSKVANFSGFKIDTTDVFNTYYDILNFHQQLQELLILKLVSRKVNKRITFVCWCDWARSTKIF